MKTLYVTIAFLFCLALVGCTSALDAFVGRTNTQQAKEDMKESTQETLAKQEPPDIGSGSGTTVIGDKPMKELRRIVEATSGTESTSKRSLLQDYSAHLTIIGFAVGLGLLALVAWLIYRKLKQTGAIDAMKRAVEPLVERIKALVARKTETTDAAEVAKIDADIARLNSEKADVEKNLTKA